MQTKKNSEQALVRICMTELCKKAGFAEPENMVQRGSAIFMRTDPKQNRGTDKPVDHKAIIERAVFPFAANSNT